MDDLEVWCHLVKHKESKNDLSSCRIQECKNQNLNIKNKSYFDIDIIICEIFCFPSSKSTQVVVYGTSSVDRI